MTLSKQRQVGGFIAWLAICFAASAIGAVASIQAGSFYLSLARPAWAPPASVFGPVWAVLYALRGLAVFSVGSGRVSRPVIATVALVAMFLLPFVLAGLTLLGLADTWLDFRRRLVTTSAT